MDGGDVIGNEDPLAIQAQVIANVLEVRRRLSPQFGSRVEAGFTVSRRRKSRLLGRLAQNGLSGRRKDVPVATCAL